LGLLFQLEADRAALIAAGEFEKAHQLRRGDDSLRMLAVARLLQRDFAGALAAHREGTP
jgi:hypothetical protein